MPGAGCCSEGSHNLTKVSASKQLRTTVPPGRELQQAAQRKDAQIGFRAEDALLGHPDLPTHMHSLPNFGQLPDPLPAHSHFLTQFCAWDSPSLVSVEKQLSTCGEASGNLF